MGKETLVTDAQRKETQKHVAKCLASGWGQTKNFRPLLNAAFPSHITNHNLSLPPLHHPSMSHPFPFFISVHSGGGVQLPSHVQLFTTPWTAARQASLSPTISQNCTCHSTWHQPTYYICYLCVCYISSHPRMYTLCEERNSLM